MDMQIHMLCHCFGTSHGPFVVSPFLELVFAPFDRSLDAVPTDFHNQVTFRNNPVEIS